MTRFRVFVFLSVFAAGLCSSAGAALADSFSASGSGSATLESSGGGFTVESSGSATAAAGTETITGTYSASGTIATIPPECTTGTIPVTNGHLVLRDTVNKDELDQTYSGSACKAATGYVVEGEYVITGGTGRFAGTTGSGKIAETIDATVTTASFTESGTITFPKHPTETTVKCSPNPVEVGHPTTCTATVTDTSATKTTPTGTVSFTHTNTGALAPESCLLKATLVAGVASCSVTYAPLMTGAHEITATYGGDTTHEASKGSTTVNATAAKCQQGDNDDHNGGGDNDERDGRSGAKSQLALGGFSQPLLHSVQSDECDNDQHDRDGDNDRRGSDGD
jgi:hypothetical protein